MSITFYISTVSFCLICHALRNVGKWQCQRSCAMQASCQACQVFTDPDGHQMCYHYVEAICNFNSVKLYSDPNIIDGSLWAKLSGDEFNNTTTCHNETNCDIETIEQKPRTCWEYNTLYGTVNDQDGTPRPVWPSGYSNGTNITVYCQQGFTVILNNLATIDFLSRYTDANIITVFGSKTQTIGTSEVSRWNAYVSSIDFPTLSPLVRISNRILLVQNTQPIIGWTTKYDGFDIAPDGTLTVEGSYQVVSGLAPNGFYPPLRNSSFVNSTCGSFWKIPVTSTDICNQKTNLLTLTDVKTTGTYNGYDTSYRYVTLSFR